MNNGNERHPILLSVVLVVDRWVEQAPAIVARMAEEIGQVVADYEIILVDNGSGPRAESVYRNLTSPTGQPNLQVYRLLRRVDYEVAAWAGVENSLGDLIMVIEPFSEDLTPLREAVDAMIHERLDLVLIFNETPRRQPVAVSLLRKLYLSVFQSLGGVNLQIDASQYRLMSKRVLSYLLQQPRPAARYRALPATAGFLSKILRYRAPRQTVPGASFMVDMRRALRLLLSNSTAPARIASLLSLTGAALNVMYSIYVVVLAITRSDLQPGWVTLSLQQSGMFFLFSLLTFVLTEYLIDNIRDGRSSASYFVIDEYTSAVLTRRKRLNVETQGIPTQVEALPVETGARRRE